MVCTVNSSSYVTTTQQGTSGTQSQRNALTTITDLGATGDYGAMYFEVVVTNPSGSGVNMDCTDLYVGLASSVSLWDGGQICDPSWLSMFTGCGIFKVADWVNMNNSTNSICYPSQLPSPLNRTWGGGADSFCVPYGRVAQVCKEMSAINWVLTPVGYQSVFFSCSTTGNVVTRTNGSGFGMLTAWNVGDQIVVWGGGFQDGADHFGVKGYTVYYIKTKIDADNYTLSLSPGGATVTITSSFSGGSYSYQIAMVPDVYPLLLAIMNETKAYNPTGIVAPQIGLENWNPQYYVYQNAQIFSAFTPNPGDPGAGVRLPDIKAVEGGFGGFPALRKSFACSTVGASAPPGSRFWPALSITSRRTPPSTPGKKLSEIMDCCSTALYPHQADSTGEGMLPTDIVAAYGVSPTLAQWSSITRGPTATAGKSHGINNAGARAAEWRAALDAKRPNTPAITYEGGITEGMQWSNQSYWQSGCTFTIASPGLVTSDFLGALSPRTVWPDNYPVTFSTTGALPTGLAANTTYYVVPGTGTATTLRVSATRNGTAINFTGTQSGTHTLSISGPHIVAVMNSFWSYLQSAECGTDMTYYCDKVIRDGLKARNFAIYCLTGAQAATNISGSSWGMTRAAQFGDTPATLAIKNYTYPTVP